MSKASGRSAGHGGPPTSDMYLDLLKRSLLNEVYLDDEARLLYLRACVEGAQKFDFAVYHEIRSARPEDIAKLRAAREIGQFVDRDIHNSGFSHTMIGRQRLDSLHECLDLVLAEGIAGDFMECGVWRGGACIFMAGYLKCHGVKDRKVILADSFDGVPPSTAAADAALALDKSEYPELAVSAAEVRSNFEAYGLLDASVHFVPGWFNESLKNTPTDAIAVLRLDGDLYSSTMDCLTALYERVVPGGIVIIDDWGVLPPCRQAVEDFFASRGEELPPIEPIDWSGVYFRKPGGPPRVGRSFATGFPAEFLTSYQEGTLRYQYKGVRCIKSPIDMAIYASAIWELQPATVIEIGTKDGGSALWLADLVRAFGIDARVYSIDLEPPTGIDDPLITFVRGDVYDLGTAFEYSGLLDAPHPWFVSEDSAHTYDACIAALEVLGRTTEPGDLIAMEDGVLTELGLADRYAGGPNRAIRDYLGTHPSVFVIEDELCDLFGTNVTYAPNGYLRRV